MVVLSNIEQQIPASLLMQVGTVIVLVQLVVNLEQILEYLPIIIVD